MHLVLVDSRAFHRATILIPVWSFILLAYVSFVLRGLEMPLTLACAPFLNTLANAICLPAAPSRQKLERSWRLFQVGVSLISIGAAAPFLYHCLYADERHWWLGFVLQGSIAAAMAAWAVATLCATSSSIIRSSIDLTCFWCAYRTATCIAGAGQVASVLLQRAVVGASAEAKYPPGEQPLSAALIWGATLLMASVVFTPSVRQRCSNAVGLGELYTFDLHELSQLPPAAGPAMLAAGPAAAAAMDDTEVAADADELNYSSGHSCSIGARSSTASATGRPWEPRRARRVRRKSRSTLSQRSKGSITSSEDCEVATYSVSALKPDTPFEPVFQRTWPAAIGENRPENLPQGVAPQRGVAPQLPIELTLQRGRGPAVCGTHALAHKRMVAYHGRHTVAHGLAMPHPSKPSRLQDKLNERSMILLAIYLVFCCVFLKELLDNNRPWIVGLMPLACLVVDAICLPVANNDEYPLGRDRDVLHFGIHASVMGQTAVWASACLRGCPCPAAALVFGGAGTLYASAVAIQITRNRTDNPYPPFLNSGKVLGACHLLWAIAQLSTMNGEFALTNHFLETPALFGMLQILTGHAFTPHVRGRIASAFRTATVTVTLAELPDAEVVLATASKPGDAAPPPNDEVKVGPLSPSAMTASAVDNAMSCSLSRVSSRARTSRRSNVDTHSFVSSASTVSIVSSDNYLPSTSILGGGACGGDGAADGPAGGRRGSSGGAHVCHSPDLLSVSSRGCAGFCTLAPMPSTSLLSLPDELLAHVLRLRILRTDLCRAARVCARLCFVVEAACKLMLHQPSGSWTYVPLEASTWRARLAFGLHDAYSAARKLVAVRAGLVVYGSACYHNGSAAREARLMANVLNCHANPSFSLGAESSVALRGPYEVRDSAFGGCADICLKQPVLSEATLAQPRRAVRVTQLTVEGEDALVAEISSSTLARAPSAANALMEGIVSDEILLSPWYVATDVWMAIRLDGRAALPADGPVIAVKTAMRATAAGAEPQTEIELRDATHQAVVLGRAKLRYCTRPIDGRSGPSLSSFRVFAGAATECSLVAAALLADQARPDTRKALADAAGRSCEEATLLAARVLLWCGVEAVCSSHVDSTLPYRWPLRASPELIGKHGPFLAWRGMQMSAGRSRCLKLWGGSGGWAFLPLGDRDGLFGSGDSGDECSSDEAALGAVREKARTSVAQRLLSSSFTPDEEDCDSEVGLGMDYPSKVARPGGSAQVP